MEGAQAGLGGDVLLHHPFESFDPVESLLRARLVGLVRVEPASGEAVDIEGEEVAGLVRSSPSWAGSSEADTVGLRRI